MKIPFLMKKGFNFKEKAEEGKLWVEMTPKYNLWFYLFVFMEAFKIINDLISIEAPIKDKENGN